MRHRDILLKISLVIISVLLFAVAKKNLAHVFKPYDDFSGRLDYIDGQPGQKVTLGTKWIRFVPEKIDFQWKLLMVCFGSRLTLLETGTQGLNWHLAGNH